MSSLGTDDIRSVMAELKAMASANRDYFIQLDGVMGDSDLGLTMDAAFSAAADYVQGSEEHDIGVVLTQVGMTMAKAAPSTMGTLLATGFMRGGKAIRGSDTIGTTEYRDFWKAFVEGIMERGQSKPGEKTIVDALYPAYEAIEQCVQDGADLADTAAKASQAADQGVEKTKDMVAQHGRAAYHREKSRGPQDPGATVGGLVLAAFADYLAAKRAPA